MERKKAIKISKNMIAITLSICMLLFFGFTERTMQRVYGELGMESTESVDSTELDDSEIVDSTEIVDGTELVDSTEVIEDEIVGDTEIIEGDENIEDTETIDDTEEIEETEAEEPVIVATITYSYTVQKIVEIGSVEETTEETTTEETTEETIEEETTEEETTEEETTEETTEEATEETTEEETEESEEVITRTEEFYSLEEAFTGAKAISELLAELGIQDYVSTIQIVSDIEIETPLVNSENASFVLDLNGYCINILESGYIDFGEGCVTFTDMAYLAYLDKAEEFEKTEELEEMEVPSIGMVTGQGSYLFTGSADVCFEMGHFIAKEGSIVKEAEKVSVLGGVYIYDLSLGFVNQGELVLPEGQVLIKTQVEKDGIELVGLMLGDPNYTVEITIEEEDTTKTIKTYYADFASAWEQAKVLSSEYGVIAEITVCNEAIQGIQLSKTYELNAVVEGAEPQICLKEMNFQRAENFVDNMFLLYEGTLVLKQCHLDGAMIEENYAEASLIRVSEAASLSLINSTLENNCSVSNRQTKDPGSGVYLEKNASMKLSGVVAIRNNRCYIPESEEQEATYIARNVYMMDDVAITVLDSLAEEGVCSNIGISHENGIIAGLTTLGGFSVDFLEERGENSEELDVSDVLSVFQSDEYPSYYVSYDSAQNSMFWDKDTRYLPEAGELRFEYILLCIGIISFLFKYVPVIKKRSGLSSVFSVMGIMCLVSGIVVGFVHIKQEEKRYYENLKIVQQIVEETESKQTTSNVGQILDYAGIITENDTEEIEKLEGTEGQDSTQLESYVEVPQDGRTYIGIIEIPKLGIKLPILSDYSPANMKTTPCVYHGSIQTNNLVIVGHNYESQFGALNDCDGDIEVLITLLDGSVYTYKGFQMESLNPDQVDEMMLGDWDLTVFTCNYAGDKRVAVRCNLLQ